MEKIELACDTSCPEAFVEWLKTRLPHVRVTIGKSTWCYVDGVPSFYNNKFTDLWLEFCGSAPCIPDAYPEIPRPAIEHTWDGEFWQASSHDCWESGYGHTPDQATAVLLMMLEGRKFWFFERCEPDFSELGISSAIVRALIRNGVYTTEQLRSLTRIQAKMLDVALNSKGRVLYWHTPD